MRWKVQQLKYAIGQDVWAKLLESSDFENRHQAVLQFNEQNLWRKRGISMIPIKYGVSYTFLTGNHNGKTFPEARTQTFTVPGHWEDAVLLLEAVR